MAQPEKQEQAAIVQLVKLLGGHVYVCGTRRRRGDYQGTMQTPGIPDLMVFLPPLPFASELQLVFIECKAPGGRLSPPQVEFRDRCEQASVAHIVGGIDQMIDWLQAHGYPVSATKQLPRAV